jgi:hypothetical protein
VRSGEEGRLVRERTDGSEILRSPLRLVRVSSRAVGNLACSLSRCFHAILHRILESEDLRPTPPRWAGRFLYVGRGTTPSLRNPASFLEGDSQQAKALFQNCSRRSTVQWWGHEERFEIWVSVTIAPSQDRLTLQVLGRGRASGDRGRAMAVLLGHQVEGIAWAMSLTALTGSAVGSSSIGFVPGGCIRHPSDGSG